MPLASSARPGTPDLSQRVDPAMLPEQMDGPCSYEDFRACVRDIAAVTRLTLAYRPTRRFVARALQRHAFFSSSGPQTDRLPLRLVDFGSGGGDMLRHLAAWAARRSLPLQLTGIDINPHATRAAEEFTARRPRRGSPIQWLNGDLFTHPDTQQPDLILSSLVMHHLRDSEIVRCLRWMEQQARLGWFISDLARSARSYRLFRQLSRAARWHPFVQQDGLVSLQRAFREDDWHRLLHEAGIPAEAVEVRRCALGRLCLSRLR